MDLIADLTLTLSRWSRGHLSEISLAILATLLVLFGPDLNAWLRQRIGSFNFIFRTLFLVIFCALAYGVALVYATPWLTRGLGQLNNYALAPVLLLVFLGIGVIADRR